MKVSLVFTVFVLLLVSSQLVFNAPIPQVTSRLPTDKVAFGPQYQHPLQALAPPSQLGSLFSSIKNSIGPLTMLLEPGMKCVQAKDCTSLFQVIPSFLSQVAKKHSQQNSDAIAKPSSIPDQVTSSIPRFQGIANRAKELLEPIVVNLKGASKIVKKISRQLVDEIDDELDSDFKDVLDLFI